MKKILFAMAAAVMVFGSASCQKENLGKVNGVKSVDNPLNEITVIQDVTRLAIDQATLTPAFEENDEIFGWDIDGTVYTYKCTSVSKGAATFTRTSEGAPAADEGMWVNLLFAPGVAAKDIVEKQLVIDLSQQGALPVIMHAGGEVDGDGKLSVTFTSDVAVVDVKHATLPGAVEDEEFTLSFNAKYNSLKVALNEFGFFMVEPCGEGAITLSDKVKAGADSDIAAKFAVPATLETVNASISAKAEDYSTYTFSAGEKEIKANKYITVADKEFAPEYVAQIGDDKYTSINKAIADANGSDEAVTIKIIKDIAAVKGSQTINNANVTVTIDFNDFVINSTQNPALICSTAVVLTDGPMKKGGITGTSMVIATRGAEVTINGGNYTGHNTYGVMRVYQGSKVTINDGAFTADDKSRAINVGYNSSNVGGELIVNGGTFTSTNWGTIRGTYGNILINGGVFTSGCDSVIYASSTSGETVIKGGYFYAAEPAPESAPLAYIGGPGLVGTISPENLEEGKKPWFNYPVDNSCFALGYALDNSSSTKDAQGREYTYSVGINTKNAAEVNGAAFKIFADAFANAMSLESPVTIKLTDDVTLDGPFDFTNKNGQPVTLDLNGKTMTGTVNKTHLITTTGVLNITDSSAGEPGTITSNGYRVLFLGSTGKIDVSKVKITGTSKTGSYTGADSTLVTIKGADANSDAEMTIGGGAVVGSNNKVKTFYVNFGTLTINDAEVFCGRVGSSYHCLYMAKGGKITINEGAHFRNYEGKAIFRIGSSNSTGNTSLVINGGDFYGTPVFNRDTDISYSRVTLKGGRFSASSLFPDDETKATTIKYGEGMAFQKASQPYTYKWGGTEELTYGYEVGTAIESN